VDRRHGRLLPFAADDQVETFGERHDPREHGYRFSGEPHRQAAAIPALPQGEDGDRHLGPEAGTRRELRPAPDTQVLRGPALVLRATRHGHQTPHHRRPC